MDSRDEAEASQLEGRLVWFLVEHSDERDGIAAVADELDAEGVDTEVVSITDVIGSAAREAVAGGAERILRGLRVAWRGSGERGEEDFLGAIRRERPDLIVVCADRYVRPLSLLESLTGVSSVQVGCPLDFNLEAAWFNGSVDGFIVSDDETAGRLEEEGWAPERLIVAGPPARPAFLEELDRSEVREAMGFGDEKVVLVRADSFEPSALDRLVFQATLVEGDIRFVFHHNGDGAAASALRRAAEHHGLQAAMFGRVSDLERYVVASDVVVATPGEPLMAELVAAGSPLFLIGEIGDHRTQVATLTRHWGATHRPEFLRVGSELEEFLQSDALAEARATIGARRLRPSNADVTDALRTIFGELETWEAAEAPSPGPEPADAPDRGDQPASGPFESIGSGPSERRPRGDEGGPDDAKGGPPARRQDVRPRPSISRAEAKDQLAELILVERDLERRLEELDREQDRWRNRLDLARDWGEEDLAEEAETILRDYIDEADDLRDELEDIRRQKDKLKRAARRGQDGSAAPKEGEGFEERRREEEIEERFSEMEIDRDLDRLRDRIKGELGE